MVDRRREQAVDEAAARFADTLAESYRIVYEQAAEARERQGRLAQDFSERVMNHLKEQAESGRAASEKLVDQSRRQQEAGRAVAQESAKAYMDFLDTAFSQYRGSTQRAAGSAQEGARTLSETTAGLIGTATGAAGAMADTTADATRSTAEAAAGQPPIEGYDEMNVEEVTSRLDGLSEAELMRVRNYELRNKNRKNLIMEIDGTRRQGTTMAHKNQGSPEDALDKAVGRLGEAAGGVSGDESLEAEGRALRRKSELKSYLVAPHADGGWKVQVEGADRATSVHQTKAEAVAAGKELARGQAPSQILIYKEDGLEVQEEQTYE
jgi:uncharacterized protein YjbJ (UPF0337 family)